MAKRSKAATPEVVIDQVYVMAVRQEDGVYVAEVPDDEGITELVIFEHPQNPRRGNVEVISESIDANGWYGAPTVQAHTGFILAGNHRFRVAAAKEAAEIPVIVRECDDQTAMRILLADNKTADSGTYDQATLDAIMAGLDSLVGTGYTEDDPVGAALEAAEAAEAAGEPEVPADAYTPTYGVMLVVQDEEAQQALYEWLRESWQVRELQALSGLTELRVVAV